MPHIPYGNAMLSAPYYNKASNAFNKAPTVTFARTPYYI
jgi:hypothetical protein